jgi:hypothetical protein
VRTNLSTFIAVVPEGDLTLLKSITFIKYQSNSSTKTHHMDQTHYTSFLREIRDAHLLATGGRIHVLLSLANLCTQCSPPPLPLLHLWGRRYGRQGHEESGSAHVIGTTTNRLVECWSTRKPLDPPQIDWIHLEFEPGWHGQSASRISCGFWWLNYKQLKS